MMNLCFFTVIILIAELYAARQIPSFVNLCKKNSPNLSDCYTKSFREVHNRLINEPIPEMNLRRIDPYIVDKVSLNFGNGSAVSFDARLKDLTLRGFKTGKLEKADVSLEHATFDIRYTMPVLNMQSEYTANGKVLLLQFNTTGVFTGNLTDVLIVGTWKGKKYMKKGKEHISFRDTDIKMTIGSMKVYFSNLFPNNAELTERTNDSINENIDVLYDEVKPVIDETVKTIINDAVNNVYNRFPVEQLYPS